MRVIAGKYGGRPLKTMSGAEIRPTSDRLRETLFNVLTSGNPDAIAGTTWLDLFAGTGAVGIEALSRGAKQVTFVETWERAARLIDRNLKSLGIDQGVRILGQELSTVIWRLKREHFTADIVFLDPPYRMAEAYEQALTALAESSAIWVMSLVIAEHEKRFDPGEAFGALRRVRKLVQGNSALSFYRIHGSRDLNERAAAR